MDALAGMAVYASHAALDSIGDDDTDIVPSAGSDSRDRAYRLEESKKSDEDDFQPTSIKVV